MMGAKAIALDPDPDRIADLRAAAASAGVSVECHHGELADLGFAPSGTIDVVLANHSLDDDDDLGRTLRQVHRVLKPGAPFVLAMAHPFAAVGIGAGGALRPYGDGHRTVGELLTALDPDELPHRGLPRARRRRRPPRSRRPSSSRPASKAPDRLPARPDREPAVTVVRTIWPSARSAAADGRRGCEGGVEGDEVGVLADLGQQQHGLVVAGGSADDGDDVGAGAAAVAPHAGTRPSAGADRSGRSAAGVQSSSKL